MLLTPTEARAQAMRIRAHRAVVGGRPIYWLPSLSPPCPSYSARLSSRRAIGKK